MRTSVEKTHRLREDEVHAAGDEVKFNVFSVLRLAVDVDDFLVCGVYLKMPRADEGYVLRVGLVLARGVAHEDAQERESGDAGGYEHVHVSVVGPGVVRGVEAAAVEAAVADADEVQLRPAGEALGLRRHGGLDAFHIVHDEGNDVSGRAAYDGYAAVLVYVGAYPGVETHGTDVHAVPAVAFYDVYRPNFAVYEFREVEKPVLVLPEHLDEVVAGAAGEMGDCDVRQTGGPVHALVERTVASAGVDSQFLFVPCRLFYSPAGVHR